MIASKLKPHGDSFPLPLPFRTIKTRARAERGTKKGHSGACYKPLPTRLRRNGFEYRQIAREGHAAIYEQCSNSSVAYEVVRIRRREAAEIAGNFIEPHEVYPSSESWGVDGFTFTEKHMAFAKLRAKIDKARPGLPVPSLMRRLGYGEKHIGTTALCPFHSDEHPSFSVFQSKNGKGWQWKCYVGCGCGDEIAFLVKHFGISRRQAIRRYLEMAGLPARRRRKSREYPVLPDSPKSRESLSVLVSESPVSPVSPVSEGQGLDAKQQRFLESLAVDTACARAGDNADKKRFKLARYMRGIEKVIGRQLKTDELVVVFTKWHQVSQPFLDPAKTRDDYWIAFLAELEKVRMPFGEGTLAKALDNVSKLSLDQLPVIPGYANAPEKCRRLMALHWELHRSSANDSYFLAYRDAAKSCKGLSHQEAHTITVGVLVRYGVLKIVSKGEAGLNGAKAAEFRCLLPETENIAEEGDDECPF